MSKFPEAERRKMQGVFVCRKCKSKIKSSSMKVALGKVICRKCTSNALKPKRKK